MTTPCRQNLLLLLLRESETLPSWSWPVTFFPNTDFALCYTLHLLARSLSVSVSLLPACLCLLVRCIKNTTLTADDGGRNNDDDVDRLLCSPSQLISPAGRCVGEIWSRTTTHVTVLVVPALHCFLDSAAPLDTLVSSCVVHSAQHTHTADSILFNYRFSFPNHFFFLLRCVGVLICQKHLVRRLRTNIQYLFCHPGTTVRSTAY